MNEKPEERIGLELSEVKIKWLHLSARQRVTMLTILRDMHALGPSACDVLEMQARRLAEGAQKYGSDFAEDRDWLYEGSAEALDGFAYLTVLLASLMRKRDETKK